MRTRTALRRFVLWQLTMLVAAPVLYVVLALTALAWPVKPATAPGGDAIEAYVISNGVHTDLVLPLRGGGVDWTVLFAPSHAQAAPADAEFVAIGWGDREFYLHTPTWADLTLPRALGALLGRHPAALHVSWLQRDQLPAGQTWRLPVSTAQHAQLLRHVQRSLPQGKAQPIAGAHYHAQDAFYEATGHYNLMRTCNEWTAEALRAAGVAVPPWAPLDFGVRWHLQPLAQAGD